MIGIAFIVVPAAIKQGEEIIYRVLQFLEGAVPVPMVMRGTVGISPLLIFVSLLVGGAVGGLVGSFLAVPIAASAEIVLSRLQARETRVARGAASIESPDEDEADEIGCSLRTSPMPGPPPTDRTALQMHCDARATSSGAMCEQALTSLVVDSHDNITTADPS